MAYKGGQSIFSETSGLYGKRAEAAKKKKKNEQQKPAEQPVPERSAIAPAQGPRAGAMGVQVGGRPAPKAPEGPDQTPGLVNRVGGNVKSAVQQGGKLLGGAPDLGTFNRGAAEPAYQAQRAGERADYSGAAGSTLNTPTMPGVFQNFPAAGPGGGVPLAPDTTFSMMPTQAGDLGVSGAGATAPTAGAAEGASGLGGAASGIAGGLGVGLSAYNLANAIQSGRGSAILGSSLGTLASIPGGLAAAAQLGIPGAQAALSGLTGAMGGGMTSAAATSAAAASGATAGAGGAGTVAAGTAGAGIAAGVGAVIAPVIIGVLGYMQNNERIQAERFAARELRDKLGFSQEQVNKVVNDLSTVDPNSIRPEQLQNYVNTLGQEFQTNDKIPATAGIKVQDNPLSYAAALRDAGANPSATGDNQAQMNAAGQAMLQGIPGAYERLAYLMSKNPELTPPSWESGGGKTRDVLAAQSATGSADPYSTWYEHLPNTPNPYVSGGFDTSQEGGPREFAPVANPELGGKYSPEVLSSPYFAQEYWKNQGVTPQRAFLYGAGQNAAGAGALPFGLPAGGGDYAGYDPAAMYQYLLSQGMPSLDAQQATQTGGAPQETVGGMQGGDISTGVGKLQPRNLMTGGMSIPRPESDAREAFGMRRPGGAPGQQQPTGQTGQAPSAPTPGTSGAEAPPYGMQPGFPQAKGGNIGTGGLQVSSPFGVGSGRPNRGGGAM